jgi:hypothetical protein
MLFSWVIYVVSDIYSNFSEEHSASIFCPEYPEIAVDLKSYNVYLNLKPNKQYMRFEVSTAVRRMMMFFWVSAPCRFVGRFQRFEETYCLHLQG